jgi:hypothetical protein
MYIDELLFIWLDPRPIVPLLLLSPPFFRLFFRVHRPVDRDDWHLLAHAMASDFSVAWQFSQREQLYFLLRFKFHTYLACLTCRDVLGWIAGISSLAAIKSMQLCIQKSQAKLLTTMRF